MFQQLLSLLQLLGIVWFKMFIGETVSVSTNIPAQLNPGEEFVAEITINRGNLSGFVKFQQDIPEGFLVSEVDSKGGNFSFTEQSMKIVWISFPAENEVKIKYKLSVLSTTLGAKTINGKISYLDNNDKKTFTLTPISLNIGTIAASPATPVQTAIPTTETAKVAESTTTPSSTTSTPVTEEKKEITPSPAATSPSASSTDPNGQNGPIKCKREIININSKEVLIKLTIENPGLKGFAKLEDVIPMGFNVKLVQARGASFSFINQKARILWLEMPATPSFSCSYKIIKAESEATSIDLEGLFSYLNEGAAVNYQLATPGIEFKENPNSAQEMAAFETANAAEKKTAAESKKSSSKTTTTNNSSASSTSAAAEKKSSAPSSPSTSTSADGIVYKVQVCALRKPSTTEAVNAALNVNESLELEMHDGWQKFIFGNFSTYAAAKEKKNEKSSLPTNPFVTAYNSGSRITVQEGLMLSKQAWLK